MSVRIIHQRTGETVAVFDTYEEAGRHRAELRKALPPDQPCPYAIRKENP